MQTHTRDIFLVSFVALCAVTLLVSAYAKTSIEIEQNIVQYVEHNPYAAEVPVYQEKNKPHLDVVKGLYLTAYSASNPTKRKQIVDLISTTELNAVVIDIKDYSGYVLYDSTVPLVDELDLESIRLKDVPAIIKEFHDAGVYVIARQTVFQDPVLAEAKPEWAFASTYGGIWRDTKGLAWVNPSVTEVWKYNMDIAHEAVNLGFDEINFDYVRFPSDGDTSAVVYTYNEDQERYDVMRSFFQYIQTSFATSTAQTSLDMFGFVMERHDGMSIGQRLEDAVGTVDAIAPMMYPSHYPSGHLGLSNPAAHPYEVIANGMEKGVPYVADSKTKIRPWIQAFNIGAVYDADKIRAQIDAVEAYPNGGWLLWNAANRYTSAGLKSEGE